jgi:hypothetical protein
MQALLLIVPFSFGITLHLTTTEKWWHQVADKSLGEPVRAVFFFLANYHQKGQLPVKG